ncbi:unnamed protein product, partial [Clonostachys solani]
MRLSKSALPLLLAAVSAQKTCYRLDGSEASSEFTPCNPNAKVSACCHLNKEVPDICLSSGLCLSQQPGYEGLIYSNGCTDKTGKDAACPRPCADGNTKSVTAYNVLPCAPGRQFCCRVFGDNNNCCGDIVTVAIGSVMTVESATQASTTMSAGGDISGTISTTNPTIISCANSTDDKTSNTCPTDNSVVIGSAVGGALGALLLCSLGTIMLLLLRRTK